MMANTGGVPEPLQDRLTILTSGSTTARDMARGHVDFRHLLGTMHTNRIERLEHAGFTTEQANRLSELRTPNFM